MTTRRFHGYSATKGTASAFAFFIIFAILSCPQPITELAVRRAQDSLAPVITILSPQDGSAYSSSVAVSGTLADSSTSENDLLGQVREASYEVLLTDISGRIVPDGTGAFSFAFSASGHTEELRIRISAWDWKGNASSTDLRLVNGGLGPYIAISSPMDNSPYAGSVNAIGKVSNSESNPGISEVKTLSYSVLGSALGQTLEMGADGSFAFTFLTAALTGNQTLEIAAEDWNGNVSRKRITLLDGGSDIPSLSIAVSGKQATLAWDPVPNALGYTLYYSTNGSLPSDQNGLIVPGLTSPHVVNGLELGRTYVFRLKALPLPGFPENWSSFLKAIPLSGTTLAPRLTGEEKSIRVEWKGIIGSNEFEVWRSTSYNGEYTNISGPVSGTTYLDTAVADHAWYYYKVKPSLEGSPLSGAQGGQTDPLPRRPYLQGALDTDGNAFDIQVVNGLAYIADYGRGLKIVDVSDASAPRLIGQCAIANAYAVSVEGQYACVADSYDGIRIVNITNPNLPQVVGTYDPVSATAYGVALRGTYVYAAMYGRGLDILSIADPANPTLVGSYPMGAFAPVSDVYVYGSFAFISNSSGATLRINIGDPANPGSPQTLPTNSVQAMYGLSDWFFASHFGGLGIYSSPYGAGEPIYETSFYTSTSVQDIVISDSSGYLAAGSAGLYVLDLSDPLTPIYRDLYDTPGNANALAIDGNRVFIADGEAGLRIVTVPTSVPASIIGHYKSPTSPYASCAQARGNVLYIADGNQGIVSLDISIPSNPVRIGSVLTAGTPSDFVLSGDFVYVANSYDCLAIIDITNSMAPVLISQIDFPPGTPVNINATDIELAGDFAYLSSNEAGIFIFDISDPSSPVHVSSYMTVDEVRGLCVRGTYLFAAVSGSGIQIIDVSTPANPRFVSLFDIPGNPSRIFINEDFAYVADGGGIRTIDISNPLALQALGYYDAPGQCWNVAANDKFAFVADYALGLEIIDISSPSLPRLVGARDTDGNTVAVSVSGRYAYVSDSTEGLVVMDLMPE